MRCSVMAGAAGALAMVSATAVAAQDFSMMSNFAQQQMLNDNLQRNLNNATSPTTRRGPAYGPSGAYRPAPPRFGGGPVSRGGAALAPTTYRASPAVTARVREQFVDFVRSRSGAAGADAMARAFASQDLLQSWARQASADGMRLGDVADAMAEYWVTNWMMATGSTETPPALVRAVRDQVRATMSENPGFARLTDAQRQEMAEVLIYNTLLQGEVEQHALKTGDRALQARLADAAVARFRNEMHLDLRRLQLTPAGFVNGG